MSRRVLLLAVAIVVCSPEQATGGGYYVPDVGPRGASMGGALAAQDADPSAIFHNPAGMSGQSGTQVQLVGTVFFPNVEFFRRPVVDPNSPSGDTINFARSDNTNTAGVAPYLGVVSDLGGSKFSAGVALSVPFGAAIDYADDHSQRHVVTGVALAAIHLSPAVSYQVTDQLRVGVAANLVHASLTLEQRNAIQYLTGDPEVFPDPDPAVEGQTTLEATDPFSVSATVGALYSPTDQITVGASLLTPVTLNFGGDATVTNAAITELSDGNGNMLQPAGERRDQFATQLELPLIARVGVAFRPIDRLLVAVDVNWQRWSTSDELVIDFENEHELLPTPGANLYDITVENDWTDTFTVRVGGEYAPVANNPLVVRGGVVYDQSPVDDAHYDLITPDADKVGVGVGAGYRFSLSPGIEVDVDVSYQHLFVAERDIGDSDKTILNKPAPSFYSGVSRARFDVVQVGANVRF